jgi:hypothetical protein
MMVRALRRGPGAARSAGASPPRLTLPAPGPIAVLALSSQWPNPGKALRNVIGNVWERAPLHRARALSHGGVEPARALPALTCTGGHGTEP